MMLYDMITGNSVYVGQDTGIRILNYFTSVAALRTYASYLGCEHGSTQDNDGGLAS